MSAEELVEAVGAPTNITRNRLDKLDYKYAGFLVAFSSKEMTVVEVARRCKYFYVARFF